MGVFQFKKFSVKNEQSALKVGTDAVLLGALCALPEDTGSRLELLDIGTGTGVIALMLAQRLSERRIPFQIEGIDIDEPSVKEASENFAASAWSESLSALHCPLQQYVPKHKLNLIFSNPPFFDSSLVNPDGRLTVARHTGSLSYREICAFAKDHLLPGGSLCLIVPADVVTPLVRTAASFNLTLISRCDIKTTPAKPVKRVVAQFALDAKTAAPMVRQLLLCDSKNADGRTDEYRELLHPFLLNA